MESGTPCGIGHGSNGYAQASKHDETIVFQCTRLAADMTTPFNAAGKQEVDAQHGVIDLPAPRERQPYVAV